MSFSVRARGMPAGPGLSALLAVRFGDPRATRGTPLCLASASLGSCDFPPLGVTPGQGGTGSGWCGGE